MKVIHQIGSVRISKDVKENIGFALTNRQGSYCAFYTSQSSRYHGLFFFDKSSSRMFKFIEEIRPASGLSKPESFGILRNFLYFAERGKSSTTERFFMPRNENSLVYELSRNMQVDILLDCKDSYDNRVWGRYYDIFKEKDCTVVKFTKRTDRREDVSDGLEEFSLYLAIRCNSNFFQANNSWIEKRYDFDEQRNSKPFLRHVYDALRLEGTKFVFSMSKSKSDAIKECRQVYNNIDEIKKTEKENFDMFISKDTIKKILKSKKIENEIKLAYANVLWSLDSLLVHDNTQKGVFAGLPWFFQFWSRDIMVSLKSISGIHHFFAERLIEDYLKKISPDGRLFNLQGLHSSAILGTADAHGWLSLRCRNILNETSTRNDVAFHKFSYEIEKALEKSFHRLVKHRTSNDFEFNEPKETWVDTSSGGDDRAGIRIEIQALRLGFYRTLFELTQDSKYKILENVLKEKVRQKFWNGKILADGVDDWTQRPNIFIASYVYPELLGVSEWEDAFGNALKALWLEWGGLSTIDKQNSLFTPFSTGEIDVQSYHRGDSWFWINNLGGLTMHRINKLKFRKYINKIIEASTGEILWKGCVGCHCEISDAKQLSSKGCFNQAWSNAMYAEMIEEIFQ